MQVKTTCLPLALALALTFAGAARANNIIRIGHVGPITGTNAHLGKDNEYGARMAIEDLNAMGFMINGKKARFELLAEDDAADPKQGPTVAQKLVDAKVNGVIGHMNSGTTMPASKIYFDAGIPQISPAATTPQYTQQGFNTTFRVVANDNQLGGALGRYAIESLKATTIAVIDDRSAYGQGVADEFIKGAKARMPGVRIVGRQFTHVGATDFSAILTNIKSKKPNLVFYGGMDSAAGPMLKQMKVLGVNANFMGGDGICTDSLLRLAGDGIVDGRVTCAEAGGVKAEQEKAFNDFLLRFRKKYKLDVQIYAPYVYDAVMVMAKAMQNAKSADPARYLPELKKIQYQGVTGLISFDDKGDIKDGSLTLYTYKGGKRVKMDVLK